MSNEISFAWDVYLLLDVCVWLQGKCWWCPPRRMPACVCCPCYTHGGEFEATPSYRRTSAMILSGPCGSLLWSPNNHCKKKNKLQFSTFAGAYVQWYMMLNWTPVQKNMLVKLLPVKFVTVVFLDFFRYFGPHGFGGFWCPLYIIWGAESNYHLI